MWKLNWIVSYAIIWDLCESVIFVVFLFKQVLCIWIAVFQILNQLHLGYAILILKPVFWIGLGSEHLGWVFYASVNIGGMNGHGVVLVWLLICMQARVYVCLMSWIRFGWFNWKIRLVTCVQDEIVSLNGCSIVLDM